MNKGLAAIIRDKLKDIPFIELFGGIVYTQTKVDRIFAGEDDEIGRSIEYKFPVTCDYTGSVSCDHKGLKDFIPNGKLKGMMYFEDNGILPNGTKGGIIKYISRLRMIVWLNTKFVDMPPCSTLTTPVMNGILERLIGKNPFNQGDFQSISIRIEAIPAVSIQLFNRYSYSEKDTQFLMPPYEYFAIDLAVDYNINPYCLNYIQTKTPELCS
ncbi:MAG: hypothetical protein QM802_19905 [Agriterribacter sp.]